MILGDFSSTHTTISNVEANAFSVRHGVSVRHPGKAITLTRVPDKVHCISNMAVKYRNKQFCSHRARERGMSRCLLLSKLAELGIAS